MSIFNFAPEKLFCHLFAKIFERRSFINISRWPANNFPWTQKKITFCLSFDCDTEKDAAALPKIIEILECHDLKSSFAVCGQMVKENPQIYGSLINHGHEIMNHGFSKHAEIQKNGKVISTIFYNELDEVQIRKEIGDNHQIVKALLDYEMVGFRVPHFGTYQGKEQIEVINRILGNMGYLYDSSMLMVNAKKFDLLTSEIIKEFPLTPLPGFPLSVFDSWSLMQSKKRTLNDFFVLFKKMFKYALRSKDPILINIYVDPSHIVEFEGFRKSLNHIDNIRKHIYNNSYRNLLEKNTSMILDSDLEQNYRGKE